MRLLFVVNTAKFFLSHRLPLAQAAAHRGATVHIAAPDSPDADSVRAKGFAFHPIPLTRRSIAPWNELRTVLALRELYRSIRPDLVHHITLKPVLYGTIAAHGTGVPAIVNAVTGLGYLFTAESMQAALLRRAFLAVARHALRAPNATTIFQNSEDLSVLVDSGAVDESRAIVIAGSGVDIDAFRPSPEPEGPPIAVLPARLLWDKGVGVFVDAARILRARGVTLRMVLVGEPDPGNPASVAPDALQQWREEGVVEHWGFQRDMPAVLAGAHIVAAPSQYREGVPKVVIEACASGRPVVTSDMPGCRDAVRHEWNGLVIPPGDPVALADALARLASDPALRQQLGRRGRERAEQEFAVERVVRETLRIYDSVLPIAQQPAA